MARVSHRLRDRSDADAAQRVGLLRLCSPRRCCLIVLFRAFSQRDDRESMAIEDQFWLRVWDTLLRFATSYLAFA